MTIKNQVQLITYPDSLGGDLSGLESNIEQYFPGLFPGGIHILPPFPSSGDRGFAPLTYAEIEPAFGTWEDIKRIGEKSPVLLDLMVNHISAKSAFFQDFLKNGRGSRYADMFITLDKFWPDGIPDQKDIDKMFLRRTVPYSEFSVGPIGQIERVWTTFGKTTPSEQIDMDVNSPVTRKLLADFMENFGRNNVTMLRLDAVGYVTKKLGTSCFFDEPEIYDFLEWISNLAHAHNIEILPEIHTHYQTQFKLAQKGYWIYDFILPYAILDAFINKTNQRLNDYLKARPPHQFTMLDCHDGVPLKPDLNGLYKLEDAQKIVDTCLERGGNLSRIISSSHKDADGLDVHQIRGTYFSLLDCNDTAYLAARAIQFFVPGIPQVYYVGLLAGKNDVAAVEKSGEGREINRHNYTKDEIEREMDRDVVKKLMQLIRFRNTHPAFNGIFAVEPGSDQELNLLWKNADSWVKLSVSLEPLSAAITFTEIGKAEIQTLVL
jgi:sucrose 6(F)-phosphate phosphorylase